MLTPRQWQTEALERWQELGRGVISVVTGGGKTAFAIIAFLAQRARVADLRLVVVVPSQALLDQWVIALGTEAELSLGDIATFSGEGRAARPAIANVVVINTARQISRELTSGAPCLFVVDECHRAGSPENARALDVEATYRLGLSATPVREFDEGFQEFVEPALGSILYEYDYVAARKDGVIADFSLHNFEFQLSATEQEEYERITSRVGRALSASDGSLEDPRVKSLLLRRARLVADSPRRTAAAVAVSERFDGPKLVFHERIAQANTIVKLLDARGERVGVYHSQLGQPIRRRNLELFKLGQFSTLVTCRALDEGLNVPDARAAVIAASTRSTRQRIQRLGRVLRVSPGKQSASVATLYATDAERKALEKEASAIGEVAETKWYRVTI
jgi:superfamily II DNA or RNA helicase